MNNFFFFFWKKFCCTRSIGDGEKRSREMGDVVLIPHGDLRLKMRDRQRQRQYNSPALGKPYIIGYMDVFVP